MDVTKAPPTTDLANLGVGMAAGSAAASPSSAAAGVSTASNASTAAAAAADRVDIQPLDVAAALQILIAEVRAELPLPGATSAAGMALGGELTDMTPPASQAARFVAAELVTAEHVTADLVTADLVTADLVATRMPGAVLAPAPPAANVATGPPPTQLPGLALLESQAMPFAQLSNPEQGVPLAPSIPLPDAPIQEPSPVAPDLPALLLGSEAPVGPATQTPGYLPQAGDPSVGGGAAAVPWPASLPAGGPLPRVELPVTPPDLDLGPLEPLFMPPGPRLSSPAQASPVLVRLFLQAVPEDAGNPARWSDTVTQLEVTLQSALDRAVAAVEQWRNVPQVVVDAARETRSVVMSQLSDDPPGPLWLRPEWMWLTPRMDRFRRRRRLARRGLTDPDSWARREDDTRQESPGRPQDET